MAGIGHNSGRDDAPGKSWRTFAWAKARRKLMPRLPIEVVRRRVKRAQELGLPYKTYAGLRAQSGDDLIGFMFSTNALGVLGRKMRVEVNKENKINNLKHVSKVGLLSRGVDAAQVIPPLDSAYPAPAPMAPWTKNRDHLEKIFTQAKRPASRFVLVCDTAMEREWCEAGRLPSLRTKPACAVSK